MTEGVSLRLPSSWRTWPDLVDALSSNKDISSAGWPSARPFQNLVREAFGCLDVDAATAAEPDARLTVLIDVSDKRDTLHLALLPKVPVEPERS
jgi:hypothetical protein